MAQDKSQTPLDRVAKALFYLAAAVMLFGYGMAVGKYQLFPYHQIDAVYRHAGNAWNEMTSEVYSFKTRDPSAVSFHNPDQTSPGLRMVTRVGADLKMVIEVIDTDFQVLHHWVADWHELWPDADHVPEDILPQSRRGTHVHGAVVLPNGDLVFNFEHMGLICLDIEGNVRWKLKYQTHHSVTLDPEGNLWASGQKRVFEPQPSLPHRIPPYDEYTILQVSPKGKILKEYSVQGLLQRNGYTGVIPSMPEGVRKGLAYDDRLHLNDVEPFPKDLKPGFFGPGDVAVSLRNPGIVFVFNTSDEVIKFFHYGVLVRQHDPDFIDGDRLMVFDNRPKEQYGTGTEPPGSRIVILSRDGDHRAEVVYEGNAGKEFYSPIMGKQQLLPNGNVLITESTNGRAFEVTPAGEIVWQFVNRIDEKNFGLVTEVSRLPEEVARLFRSRYQQ